ncbi:AraC family transcriptional regulator [Lactobacillus kalixensis]|uniref:Raffinose operon transcriptional regulator n=1 Tax=Lactobacillus kalixensis DSM 16043 TaxID=1423763 RepID=A0A0R1UDS2_9LACO|nr:AraC family ligand binding domain-containing protein [Lactobacillus kalixensis]KRL91548.1 raffinose operon transcriptional regulator [Lactobacillus kalixensis DSM 16043]
MDGEYRTLSGQGIESNILFFGQENCQPNYIFKGNNVRDNYVIHYVQKGKGIFSSANHPVTQLKAGDIFILPKDVPCFYQADSEDPWSYFWIGLSGTRISSIFQNSLLSQKNYLRQMQDSKFKDYLFQLFDAIHLPSSLANDLLIESLLYHTFYYLLTEYPNPKSKNTDTSKNDLKLAVIYLENNFRDSSCNITDLCQKLNISRSYLYSLFKKNLALSPQQFLIKIRMEEAKQLLKTKDEPIKKIAGEVGYSDEFTFSKAFKRYNGLSPKNFRM